MEYDLTTLSPVVTCIDVTDGTELTLIYWMERLRAWIGSPLFESTLDPVVLLVLLALIEATEWNGIDPDP